MYDLLNLFIILHEYLSFENRFGYKSKHLRVSIAVVEELKLESEQTQTDAPVEAKLLVTF